MADRQRDERKSKYPWERWSVELPEGKAWLVERFRDYQCLSTSFASQVRKHAADEGLKAAITIVIEQNPLSPTRSAIKEYVLFVFYDGNSFWRPNLPAFKDVQKMRRKLGYE